MGELISLAGSKAHSSDFYDSPALTLMNLEGDHQQAHPGPKFDYYSKIDDWKQNILYVHFKEEPDVFCAWSDDPEIPTTYSGYQIRFENAWQNPNGKIVHWPVNKRPYTSAYASGGTWKAEVSHACLVSWGIRDGIEWQDNYKVDKKGRKYREWVSLVGLNQKDNEQEIINRTRTWLFKGDVKISGKGVKFLEKNYKNNSFVFQAKPNAEKITFHIIPEEQNSLIMNPVIRINNWGQVQDIDIFVDNNKLEENDYKHCFSKKGLLIWINTNLQSENQIRIEKNGNN